MNRVHGGRNLWQSRTGDYIHTVLVKGQGSAGVYFGGYQDNRSQVEQEGLALAQIDTSHVRNKKETRHLDVTSLLLRCSASRCWTKCVRLSVRF